MQGRMSKDTNLREQQSKRYNTCGIQYYDVFLHLQLCTCAGALCCRLNQATVC